MGAFFGLGMCIGGAVAGKDPSKTPLPSTLENEIASVSQSISIDKQIPQQPEINSATFGAGCYWGTQKFFEKNFVKKSPGILDGVGQVGFMGPEGSKEDPSYKEVCSGSTGHVEVYTLKLNYTRANYRDLVKFFFTFHDPTTLNCQGNDAGTQYASVIYCHSEEQFKIATETKKELQDLLNKKKIVFTTNGVFKGDTVTTDVRMSTKFYEAHDEHQEYLDKNPNGYCNHRIRFQSFPYRPESSYDDVSEVVVEASGGAQV